MNISIIEGRLKKFDLQTKQQEKHALREIAQEIALSGLARTDFFKHVAFIGGSCLRIVHGLKRFSEDLDFWTLEPSPNFEWKHYLQAVQEEFRAYAFHMNIEDQESDSTRKRAFLKQESIKKILILTHARKFTDEETLKIKFEIDTHPPSGSGYEPKNLEFPYPFAFTSLDQPSLFASKILALFDQEKEKGRHWFDFLWYISQKWPVNYQLLGHGTKQDVNLTWLQRELTHLIQSRNWSVLKADIKPFITPEEQEIVDLWNSQFFLGNLEALVEYLQPKPISIANLIADVKGKQLFELVKQAIENGAPINDDTRNGHRPLQMSLAKGYDDIAKLLIDHGADPNFRDRSGLTPLQTAVNHGHFELARLLIDKGAIFNRNAPNLAFDYQKLYQFTLGK
jgi:hypothetical protein